MRAILCKELGPADKLVIDDIPSPEAGKGQVKVKVKAAGLNFPDTLIIEGKYQIKPELPFSPGGEMAGEVIAVGAGVQRRCASCVGAAAMCILCASCRAAAALRGRGVEARRRVRCAIAPRPSCS